MFLNCHCNSAWFTMRKTICKRLVFYFAVRPGPPGQIKDPKPGRGLQYLHDVHAISAKWAISTFNRHWPGSCQWWQIALCQLWLLGCGKIAASKSRWICSLNCSFASMLIGAFPMGPPMGFQFKYRAKDSLRKDELLPALQHVRPWWCSDHLRSPLFCYQGTRHCQAQVLEATRPRINREPLLCGTYTSSQVLVVKSAGDFHTEVGGCGALGGSGAPV